MTNIHFTTRYTRTAIVCLSLFSILGACSANNGYYDAKGNYISSRSSYNTNDDRTGRTHHEDTTHTDDDDHSEYSHYDHRGYYDRNGDYITKKNGLNVPENMFPPRGMCRVWFANRRVSEQPDIESCKGLTSRVPSGAYVIYGG